jgi:hypothetical protein
MGFHVLIMNDYFEVMLTTPRLLERYFHSPSNLVAFMQWFMDDQIGCQLKTRTDDNQIQILSFIYSYYSVFVFSDFQDFLVRFAVGEPIPSTLCLVLVKNIIQKVTSILFRVDYCLIS